MIRNILRGKSVQRFRLCSSNNATINKKIIEHPGKTIFSKTLSTLNVTAWPCTSVNCSFSTQAKAEISFEYQSMDFFEEPVSFLAEESAKNDSPTESLLVFDTHLVQLLSKGQASSDGGDEFGIPAKAAHSAAITWADLIRHLSFWCKKDDNDTLICDAPMLAVAAFAPMLVQGGKSYLINLDENYVKGNPSFRAMIQAAINRKDDERLTQRECLHLWALSYLYQNEHAKALNVLWQLLECCPGDALALSLAQDIADEVGDKKTAFRFATCVASYWNERGRQSATGQTSIAGHSIGSSLIAKGLAIGGRLREAEQMADKSLSRDSSFASGVAAAALAHIYHAEGRASEGASTFTGHGVEYYEQCGYLFFNSKMGGAGAGFIVDRDGASADRVAVRLYDEHFSRILEYSGYDGSSTDAVVRRIPSSKKQMLLESASGAATSFFGKIFGGGPKNDTDAKEIKNDDQDKEEKVFQDAIMKDSDPRTLEDVLTWLPPTTNFLVDATFLLFRLTISGALDVSDNRWQALQMAWKKILEIEQMNSAPSESGSSLFSHAPLTRVTMSLVLGEFRECSDTSNLTSKKLEEAACRIGVLMNIKSSSTHHLESNHEADKIEWAKIVRLLNESRTGWAGDVDATKSLFQPSVQLVNDIEGYDLNWGDFIDQAICYAAIKSEDYSCLCVARSICSSSVFLQTNSPANWHRYGTILEKLGDKDNARDAFHASVSLGSGEGGRVGN